MKFETLWIDSRETAKQEEEWLPKLEMHGHRAFHKEMLCFRSLFSLESLSSEHLAARSFLLRRAGSAPEVPDPVKSPDGRKKHGQDVCTDSYRTGKCCRRGRKGTWKRHTSLCTWSWQQKRGQDHCTAPCASIRDTQKEHSGPWKVLVSNTQGKCWDTIQCSS